MITELLTELSALILERNALRVENEVLKDSVIAFLAPHAVQYAKDHGLDGLHPAHYDLLKKCGARMDDCKRAEIPE